ncbi:MAG: 50S ribosomal protein L3 [Halanaerobiales bacterium]
MSRGIIGKKMGMTQIFADDGTVIPVTVIKAGPCVVVQKKTKKRDGYDALQLGFESIDEYKLNKPERGHFKRAGVAPQKHLKEFRNFGEKIEEGDTVTVDQFEKGERVNVSGVTKGKGFSGNVRRWNHSTGPKTHGSRFHRAPGSIGAVDASRVFKGQKLPGRMGHDNITIENLEIVDIDSEKDVMLIKGSVPGPKKGILAIETISG